MGGADIFKDRILDGQHAVIAGGSSGIGLGVANRYAQHGANVTVLGRNPDKLAAAKSELESYGTTVTTIPIDVRDFEAMEAAMAEVSAAVGPIDIALAAAAGNFPAPAVAMSGNGFAAVIDIDLRGAFHTFRTAFPNMTKPGGRCIAISAPQAVSPVSLQVHVGAAKAGIDNLIKGLALEWGPVGVTVTGFSPGPIADTEGMARLTPTPEAEKKMADAMPLKRYGTVDEMADIALFLASPAAAYITGHTVAIDGGMALLGAGVMGAML